MKLQPGALTRDPIRVTDEIGTTGLRQFGGFIHEEFLPDLRGRRKMAQYREMADNDIVISTVLSVYQRLQSQRVWTAAPSIADDAQALKWSDRLREAFFEDMEHPFIKIPVTSIDDSLTFGAHLSEMVFKMRDDGLVTFKKFAPRSMEAVENWVWDTEEDKAVGFVHQNPSIGVRVTIPLVKCLHVTHRPRYDNPEGTSALRGLFTTYAAVKKLRMVEGIGYERNVSGMPIMEVPPEILDASRDTVDSTVYNEFKKLIQQIKRDEREGLIIPAEMIEGEDGKSVPTGYKFRFANAAAHASMAAALHATIVRLETHIARGLQAEFLMMGSADSSGSYSMHEDKTSLFALHMDGLADTVRVAMNNGPIRVWAELNHCPPEFIPTLEHAPLQKTPLKDLGEFIKQMVDAMVLTPTPELEGFVAERAGLPIAGVDEVD